MCISSNSIWNKLYIEWLREWEEDALSKGLKMYKTFRLARQSMQSSPLEIGHPVFATQLQGIGPYISAKLEKRLASYCLFHGIEPPKRSLDGRQPDDHSETVSNRSLGEKMSKLYKPKTYSGPYAILMALSGSALHRPMTKSQVLVEALKHLGTDCHRESGKKREGSVWPAMRNLIDRQLCFKQGNPAQYGLTVSGKEVMSSIRGPTVSTKDGAKSCTPAAEAMRNDNGAQSDTSLVLDSPDMPTERSLQDIISDKSLAVLPHTFKVVLLIDNRELIRGKAYNAITKQLSGTVDFETRALAIGDFLWIAKCGDGREFVLDYVVERKRMDDLVGSIKDGRFHEQKNRLSKCGVGNVIFVIEDTKLNAVSWYMEAIKTAISSTQVVDGFFVKRVQNLDATMQYLIRMTKRLVAIYETRSLHTIPDHMVDCRTFKSLQAAWLKKTGCEYSLSFTAFQELSAKTLALNIGENWLKMLLAIRGLSLEKAVEVQKHFPTLPALLIAYDACKDQTERDRMVAAKCTGYGRKAVGVALSKKMASLFAYEHEH